MPIKPELELETCVICDNNTDKAGKQDDSLYSTWNITAQIKNLETNKGEEIGPLCMGCYSCLDAIGLLEDS